MGLYDWLLFLHVLSAFLAVGALTALWALVLSTRGPKPSDGLEPSTPSTCGTTTTSLATVPDRPTRRVSQSPSRALQAACLHRAKFAARGARVLRARTAL